MDLINYFNKTSVEEIAGVSVSISDEMFNKIVLWDKMRRGAAPWNNEAKPCGILPQISGRLNYFVTREIGLDVENDAIKKPLTHLNKNIDKIVEYIVLLGAGIVRPVYANNKLQYEIVGLGNYLPTAYDLDGTLTGAVIFKQIEENNRFYILCERHEYDGANHTTELQLYEKKNDSKLRPVPLTACSTTATLTPKYTWNNCGRPMIIEFRNHATNRIDDSNTPVAMIDSAIDLIKKADYQLERMDWEQEAGEKRVFADVDLFAKARNKDGTPKPTELKPKLNKLIQKIDGDGSGTGEKIHEYSPELRTAAQNEYLQQIFRRIELTLNVGKGTVSDAEAVTQTATQYSGGRQELFAIVDKIEDEITEKYADAAEVFAYMAGAYKLPGAPNSSHETSDLFTIKWNDDQTRKDIQQAKQTAMQEISAGVKNKWEYRRDFYGEDEATAKANVPPEPAAALPFGLE